MKKYLMFLAAFALLLVGCAQNEIVENRSEKNVIGFNTLNDRVTRHANDAEADYGVYTKWSGFTTGWYMDNQKVEGKGANVDTYTPLRYWPNTGTVNFYAYAPYNTTNITSQDVTVNSKVEFTYTVHADAVEDFTVAIPVNVSIAATSGKPTGLTNDKVKLQFEHMLTKVSVKAKLDALFVNEYELVLDNAKVKISVPHSKGTVDIMNGSPALTGGNTAADYTKNLSATFVSANEFLLFPQKTIDGSDKISIQLQNVLIKYGTETYWTGNMKTFEFETGVLSGNKFEAGKHYAITFTIKGGATGADNKPVFGDAIAFTSDVTTWGNANEIDINQPDDTTPPANP